MCSSPQARSVVTSQAPLRQVAPRELGGDQAPRPRSTAQAGAALRASLEARRSWMPLRPARVSC
eukprot:9836035-Alexandrium_andersonii.AAC.1